MRERERRQTAMEKAEELGGDALLVTHLPDVRYLTGFTGSNAAVALWESRAALFTDGRYTTQAREEAAGIRIVIGKGAAAGQAVEWLTKAGATHCAFDPQQLTVAAFDRLRKTIPSALRRKFFVRAEGLVPKCRELKDEIEIAAMWKAASLGCELFNTLLPYIRPGVPEADIAARLEYEARLAGAEGMSFETIVASGPRSALPHGRATAAKLPRRGFVTLDFGVLLNGFCSDMTRTVHLGKGSSRERYVYDSVLDAQQAAVAAVGPGVSCGELDEVARSVLRKAKLAKFFTHSTGHGVGLEIHEGPRIASKQTEVLRPGMVVTIEPGVYLPGEFGVRIEDMVLVTQEGNEVLTAASPKAWLQI